MVTQREGRGQGSGSVIRRLKCGCAEDGGRGVWRTVALETHLPQLRCQRFATLWDTFFLVPRGIREYKHIHDNLLTWTRVAGFSFPRADGCPCL